MGQVVAEASETRGRATHATCGAAGVVQVEHMTMAQHSTAVRARGMEVQGGQGRTAACRNVIVSPHPPLRLPEASALGRSVGFQAAVYRDNLGAVCGMC